MPFEKRSDPVANRLELWVNSPGKFSALRAVIHDVFESVVKIDPRAFPALEIASIQETRMHSVDELTSQTEYVRNHAIDLIWVLDKTAMS